MGDLTQDQIRTKIRYEADQLKMRIDEVFASIDTLVMVYDYGNESHIKDAWEGYNQEIGHCKDSLQIMIDQFKNIDLYRKKCIAGLGKEVKRG